MTPHPTPLMLERLLLEELDGNDLVALKEHVAECDRCALQLADMGRHARRYSRSSYSAPARTGFVAADREWKRQALAIALAPMAVLLALVVAVRQPQPGAPSPAAQAQRSGSTPTPPVPSGNTQTLSTRYTSTPPMVWRRGREAVDLRPGEGGAPVRTVTVRSYPLQLGQGAMEASVEGSELTRPFELLHTRVVAHVSGFVQSVTVTQEFYNPFRRPVEAVYLFPLPEDAAVDEMTLTAGSRVVRAQIEQKDVARRRYDEAKAKGRHAALLVEQRPNIFTQSVANLQPGERIQVALRYVSPLRYDDGAYTLNFPMVVAPRYQHGTETLASERAGRDISIQVQLDTGLPAEELWSVSHHLTRERLSDTKSVITLDPADRVPNRDFILRWRVAGERPATTVLSGEGAFALMLTPSLPPSAGTPDEARVPRELVFLVDTSGSMSGAPLEAAKSAMDVALNALHPDDTFTVLNFSNEVHAFAERPVPATVANVASARAYVARLSAGGGTEQLAGIRRALAFQDDRRLRMVLLMTDGLIGDEREVLAETERLLGNARVFGFGIGDSVNHYLLAKLSEVGRGFYQYIRPSQDPREDIRRWARRIARPVMTDIEIDWGGLPVVDVLPRKVPDLFDGQPLVLLGRYRQEGWSNVKIHGRIGSKPVTLETRVSVSKHWPTPGIRTMWARARVDEAERSNHFQRSSTYEAEVTTLGLEYHLVTPYTSLVAVDTEGPTIDATEVAPPESDRRPGWTDGRPAGRDTTRNAGADDSSALFASPKTRKMASAEAVPDGLRRLGNDEVMRLLGAQHKAFQACIETALHRQPNLVVGSVMLELTVGASGAVLRAEVTPAKHREADWARCLVSVARRMVFPMSEGETEIQVPFRIGAAL